GDFRGGRGGGGRRRRRGAGRSRSRFGRRVPARFLARPGLRVRRGVTRAGYMIALTPDRLGAGGGVRVGRPRLLALLALVALLARIAATRALDICRQNACPGRAAGGVLAQETHHGPTAPAPPPPPP